MTPYSLGRMYYVKHLRDNGETLAAIGARLGISSSRVAQIDYRARSRRRLWGGMSAFSPPSELIATMGLLNCPIEILQLSVRVHNGVRNAGAETIGQVVQLTADDICYPGCNFGKVSLRELQESLAHYGLKLKEAGHADE